MSVTARVTVTLVIPVHSTWGPDCTMSQIYKQAKVDAEGAIERAMHPEQWATAYNGRDLRGLQILSMKVEAVMKSEDDKP